MKSSAYSYTRVNQFYYIKVWFDVSNCMSVSVMRRTEYEYHFLSSVIEIRGWHAININIFHSKQDFQVNRNQFFPSYWSSIHDRSSIHIVKP